MDTHSYLDWIEGQLFDITYRMLMRMMFLKQCEPRLRRPPEPSLQPDNYSISSNISLRLQSESSLRNDCR